MKLKDEEFLKTAIAVVMRAANFIDVDGTLGEPVDGAQLNARYRFLMLLHSNARTPMWFQFVCGSLMASNALYDPCALDVLVALCSVVKPLVF